MSEENTGPSRAAMVFTGLGAVVALVVASVLAGGSNLGTTGATAGAHSSVASATQVKETGETTHVEIGVQGMSFTPSVVHVPAGNRLHITFTRNNGTTSFLLVGKRPALWPLERAQNWTPE